MKLYCIRQRNPNRQKGQALVEAAMVLSLLTLFLVLAMVLSEREKQGFEAHLLARRSAWVSVGIDGTEIALGKVGAVALSAEETGLQQQGYFEKAFGRKIETRMVRAKSQPPSVLGTGLELGGRPMEIPGTGAQKVYLFPDAWQSNFDKDKVLSETREWVGRRHMGDSRYENIVREP